MTIGRHMTRFAGRGVIEFHSGPLPDETSSLALRLSDDSRQIVKRSDALGRPLEYAYEKSRLTEALQRLAEDPHADRVEAMVLGRWSDDLWDTPPTEIVQQLIQAAPKLPNLEALFIGDLTYEENELSWIKQSDLGPLVRAFPKLKVFGARGGSGLRLSEFRHDTLETLRLETGGMSAACVRDVANAVLPALRELELWLGTEDYGGSSSVEDLAPLLSGKLFPSLDALRLRNCDYADALAEAVATAPIYQQLRVLDLSLGTLLDRSVPPLLQNPGGRLQLLDLSESYLSPKEEERLQGILPGVQILTATSKYDDWEGAGLDVLDEEELNDLYRYVTHNE